MDHSTRLTVNRPSVIFDVQGNETVIIDLATGRYFRLNPTSTEVWLRFALSSSIAEVLDSCSNAESLHGEIDGIVADLLDRALLRVAADADGRPDTVTTWQYSGFELEQFTDLEDILGLDPIHEVDPERGWPHAAER